MSLSKPKSIIYSLFIAPFRKYKKENFDKIYFQNYQSVPDLKNAQVYYDFFQPTKSLDAGCGIGNLAWGLQKLGVEAYGVDVSPQAIEQSSEEIRPFLKTDNLTDLSYPDNEFDLVVSWDVLEHIPFPECDQVIDQLFRVTRKWLLINICLWADRNARLDPTHINLHSKRWWHRFFEKKGYHLIKTPDHFPARRNAYIIKKI